MTTLCWLCRLPLWLYYALKNIDEKKNHQLAFELGILTSMMLSSVTSLAAYLIVVNPEKFVEHSLIYFLIMFYIFTGVVFFVINVSEHELPEGSCWQNSGPW